MILLDKNFILLFVSHSLLPTLFVSVLFHLFLTLTSALQLGILQVPSALG